MVSKSKILGKSPVILVTIGTTAFQFNRLFETIDEILLEQKEKYTLIVQNGKSTYKWKYKYIANYIYLPQNKLIEIVKKADKVISHAGFGTLHLLATYFKSMPLVIPRLAYYKEHVDNHQLYFSKYIKSKLPINYQKYIISTKALSKMVVNQYLKDKNKQNVFLKYLFNKNNKNKLLENLDKYLQNI